MIGDCVVLGVSIVVTSVASVACCGGNSSKCLVILMPHFINNYIISLPTVLLFWNKLVAQVIVLHSDVILYIVMIALVVYSSMCKVLYWKLQPCVYMYRFFLGLAVIVQLAV